MTDGEALRCSPGFILSLTFKKHVPKRRKSSRAVTEEANPAEPEEHTLMNQHRRQNLKDDADVKSVQSLQKSLCSHIKASLLGANAHGTVSYLRCSVASLSSAAFPDLDQLNLF